MQKRRLRMTGLAALALALAGAASAWAQGLAPLNPEFVKYLEARRAKGATAGAGQALGYIPAPFKLPPPAAALPQKLLALPATYDLRDYGKVSSVKDQGSYGNCWTFATFGSMESCLLTGETRDFSENNLANLHGYDSGYGEGGNAYMSLAYLTRWSGPVNEADDPYSNGPNSPTGLAVRKHIQTAQWIPDRTGSDDNTALKQAIMTYGGLYSSFYWNIAYYNSANAAFYYSGSSNGNHAITLVGWDDNFSRAKFNTAPPGDGAFLIKNSWNTTWGQSGYGWVSYYDSRIGLENCLFLNAAATSDYESVYQYDTLGFCTAFGYGNSTAWGANIFTGSNGVIKAVSFYAAAAGASYEVRVYTGVSAGNPVSGTLSATRSGSVAYAGYYTVVLDAPVAYATRFSVVVKFTTPGSNYPLPVEYPISGYSSRATAAAGESYISSDGSSWEEALDQGVYYHACIKAFGTGGSAGPTPTPPAPTSTNTPIMDDFDGDYYGDPTLYNGRTGAWSVRLSSCGYPIVEFPSTPGSQLQALSGFWDNDWLADPTLYNKSAGRWLMALSGDAYAWYYLDWFVNSSCLPVCADFDGDLYPDPTLYSQASGYWYILLSSRNWEYYYPLYYSASAGLLPFGGDFDGDWYADPAFYSPNSGNWYLLLSSWGYADYYTLFFGAAGYPAALGDFDGDFRADPVLRSAAGHWYVLMSGMGYQRSFDFVW